MFLFRLVLHNNLKTFGSPASTAFRSASRSASRPTAVALTLILKACGDPGIVRTYHIVPEVKKCVKTNPDFTKGLQ